MRLAGPRHGGDVGRFGLTDTSAGEIMKRIALLLIAAALVPMPVLEQEPGDQVRVRNVLAGKSGWLGVAESRRR